MKRTPLIFAALAPLVAVAGQSTGGQVIDYAELRDDLQVTSLMGTNVQSADGQDLGSIEDVMIDANGRASIIIQREGDFAVDDVSEDNATGAAEDAEPAYEEHQETFEDDAADFGETGGTDIAGTVNGEDERGMDQGMDADRAGGNEMGDQFVKVEWSAIQYNAQDEVARLSGGLQGAEQVAYEQTAEVNMRQDARASMLIGMEVNLADEESFGEVEDVMLDPATGQASAIVIDSMEFFDKERYAVPVNLDAVNAEEEELTLQYTQQQLEDMGEFEMEENPDQMMMEGNEDQT